ncbi:MAG: endonuclease III [Eubacteriaceae bacterium]|nr:endonuclease III [Eubacteriaceae bacterium]
MKFTNEQVCEILDRLAAEYPEATCALDHKDVWQLLVCVTLSAQTTDVSVNKVSPALFRKYPTVQALADADPHDVEEIIHTIGMYRTKSKNIVSQAGMLVDMFGGIVPEDDEELQKLPGVGVKTANVVMADGFGHQRIAVDTHVFRVSNRIGLVKAGDVAKTEAGLKKCLPHDRLTEAHHEMIFHGRNCCTARNPKCAECCLSDICKKTGIPKGKK